MSVAFCTVFFGDHSNSGLVVAGGWQKKAGRSSVSSGGLISDRCPGVEVLQGLQHSFLEGGGQDNPVLQGMAELGFLKGFLKCTDPLED